MPEDEVIPQVGNAPDPVAPGGGPAAGGTARDARMALSYLVAERTDDYVAVMDVLEASVSELSPVEITRELAEAGHSIPEPVVEDRLDALRQWGVVHATDDPSKILRHSDLLSRNWRYSPTAVGRQVQRFFHAVLAGTPTVREIPLAGLNRVIRALESLRDGTADDPVEATRTIFVSHDDLDAALVSAEDTLAGLADRYDLDDADTAELRSLLVDYATRVAAELEDGAAIAAHHLAALRSRFDALAQGAVAASEARTLIERGALIPAKGGRVEDWVGLCAWFDPATGRAARFSMRLVRALPGMHTNLRRLHTSTGAATSRTRALTLAAACGNRQYAAALTLAALGDHSWRKLSIAADDEELPRIPSWHSGPQVDVPDLLRLTGRAGPRGKIPAARSDADARDAVARRRAEEAAARARAEAEVLASAPGAVLSAPAARVAMDVLMAAVRRSAVRGARTATNGGLACTIFRVPAVVADPVLASERFRVWTPGRTVVFHRPGEMASCPDVVEDLDARPQVVVQAQPVGVVA